jgi:hypothetical protein
LRSGTRAIATRGKAALNGTSIASDVGIDTTHTFLAQVVGARITIDASIDCAAHDAIGLVTRSTGASGSIASGGLSAGNWSKDASKVGIAGIGSAALVVIANTAGSSGSVDGDIAVTCIASVDDTSVAWRARGGTAVRSKNTANRANTLLTSSASMGSCGASVIGRVAGVIRAGIVIVTHLGLVDATHSKVVASGDQAVGLRASRASADQVVGSCARAETATVSSAKVGLRAQNLTLVTHTVGELCRIPDTLIVLVRATLSGEASKERFVSDSAFHTNGPSLNVTGRQKVLHR